jgi:putative transport protein
MLEYFLNNQLLVLLTIILLGYTVGLIKIRGIALGNSACLFVAIGAGVIGADIPPIVTSLGIVFFVYSVGLQAGPQFFHLFGRRGLKYSVLALFTVSIGAATALLLAIPFHINISVAVGVFAGAMTSTPALASAINTIHTYLPGQSALTSVSYAIAYPFGLVSEMLFVQIVPKIFHRRLREEKEEHTREMAKRGLLVRQYRLTNSNLANKTVEELNLHKICKVNLTRYMRGEKINLCLPDTRLELGDIVVAVGTQHELDKFKILFGEEAHVEVPLQAGFEIRDIFVSGSEIAGRPLKESRLRETYGITVSRLYRGDVAITPTGEVVLEVGDFIRVVGAHDNIERFLSVAGSEKRRLDDTNILILALGMLLGVLLGELPVQIGNFTFKLGTAGGVLLTALILSHFGKIGRWSVRVPNATKFFLRDLGLVFFLIGVGVKAGHELSAIKGEYNVLSIFALGVAISLVSIFASFYLIHNVFRTPLIQSLGALCGAKTSGPSLGVLVKTLDDESPAIAYAAVYPVSIIMLTVFGQILVLMGMGILK